MKAHSPLLGFNNNVRHRGRVFHIQTEDSGVKHPHVITHLFADGGRIVRSTKTSYGEYLGDEEMSRKVRSLMQEQHKAMFIALRAGKFDHLLDGIPLADAQPGHRGPMESTLSIELEGGDKVAVPSGSPSAPGRVPQGSPSSPQAVRADAGQGAVSQPRSSVLPAPPQIEFEDLDEAQNPPSSGGTRPAHAPSEGLRRLTPPPKSSPSMPPPRAASVPPPRAASVPPPRAPSIPPPRGGSIPPPPRSASAPPPRGSVPPPRPALEANPPAQRRAPPPLPAAALRGGGRVDPRAEQEAESRPATAPRQAPPPPAQARPPLALRPSTPPPPPSAPESTQRVPNAAGSAPGRSGALLATLGAGVPSPPKPASLGATAAVPRRISPLATASLGANAKTSGAANAPARTAGSQGRPPLPGAPVTGGQGAPPAGGRPPMQSNLDLDLEALERAAEQGHSPVYRQVRDLPPPPAAVLRSTTGETAYRSITPPGSSNAQGPQSQAPGAAGAGRYAPSRPASIFGNARPQEGSSIFGEDLISEKSLDEVILSYLAEDLESPPKK